MNKTDELIDQLAEFAEIQKARKNLGAARKFETIATTLTNWRDGLMRIATNQGGVASHQAQDLLREVGYCDHARTTYKAQLSGRANAYTCIDCGKASPERLVPYR